MKNILRLVFIPILLLLIACNFPNESAPAVVSTLPTSINPTDMPGITPTESVNYIAFINEEGISEEIFQADLIQFEKAVEDGFNTIDAGQTSNEIVLDDLIQRYLLSQSAREAGFIANDEIVEVRIGELSDELGGEETLFTWIEDYGFTKESFRNALGLEIEASWQREQIIMNVPAQAEQVKARQLFFFNITQARSAYGLLESGSSFDLVVKEFDPGNLGFLGWFPRNYLLLEEIENLAFSLQLGEYSEIIETEIGYHILQVLDHEAEKELSADALFTLQEKALQEWLDGQLSQSRIEVLNP
ncbi:MAG: hypothetical protein HON98_04610 [Chloroflexi bacterium]|jgi:peptidyl-prolyl cis-trans isomerase C|nr:hypothetical protein [Chloroflexota bacterium]MBT3671180.1 hypothetical protein [Chloroflexota bacterium]MBT4002538.1 hypothetical protein [Chloroflexota bacterium]MBT4304361.1 hypothetical protein [Chloroflexota bacterium]MBT4534380.1 hypothetical protein [Chloroflexota bacterium]